MSYPPYPIQGPGPQYPPSGQAYQITPQQLQQQQQQQQQQPPSQAYGNQAPNTLVTPSNIAQLAQQGYVQQQQHLAAMQAAQAQAHAAAMMRVSAGQSSNAPGGVGGMTAAQLQQAQAHMQYGQSPGGASGSGSGLPVKKKRGRPANQMIPPPPRPLPTEHYVKQAVAPPPPPQMAAEIEPWADALDELDPRELAMGRFRVRQDILAEIFSPDPIKNIPLKDGDAWQGFGMNGETLEAKVAALETENAELQSTMEEKLEEWRKRLQDIEATGEIATS